MHVLAAVLVVSTCEGQEPHLTQCVLSLVANVYSLPNAI